MSGSRGAKVRINGIPLDEIDDASMISSLINSTEDRNTCAILRARLQEIKSGVKAAPTSNLSGGSIKTTTTTTTSISSARSNNMRLDTSGGDPREQAIQARQREAAESKARTLAMYDNMAKSGNAGDKRALDINTYRGSELPAGFVSGSALQKTDIVEETIRERVRASEQNKKRLLAAFDYAAKTQPAGTVRDVDLASFQGVDVSSFEQEKPAGAATFRSSNGVPQVVKVNQSAPSTPQIDIKKAPSFTQEQPHLDAYERALRARKQEADERKARLLAGYDAVARSGVCGPKIVVREELEQLEIPSDALPPKPKFSCTSSFTGGYARS